MAHVWSIKEKKAQTFDCEDIFQTVKSRKRHEILVFQSTTPLKIASKENRAAMEKRNSERNKRFIPHSCCFRLRPFYLLYPWTFPSRFYLIEKNTRNSWDSERTVSDIQNLYLIKNISIFKLEPILFHNLKMNKYK